MDMTREHLEKVEHDLGFAYDGLRRAYNEANQVERIIIIDLLKRVNEARNGLGQFCEARIEDQKQ